MVIGLAPTGKVTFGRFTEYGSADDYTVDCKNTLLRCFVLPLLTFSERLVLVLPT